MKRDGAAGENEPVSVNMKNTSVVSLVLVLSSTLRCQVIMGRSKRVRITFTEYPSPGIRVLSNVVELAFHNIS